MHLSLAGLSFDLGRSDAEMQRALVAEWPEFVSASALGHPVRIDVARVDRPIPLGSDPGVVVQRTDASSRMTRADFVVEWDARDRAARVELAGAFKSFAAAMRVLLAEVLRGEQGALFHASSVRVGGEALLFPGISGTGKTTVAALGSPRRVLSDEISAVRIEGDRAFVHPTPFWGDMERVRAAESAPLRAVVLLSRGVPVELTTGAPADAIVALLEGALVFGSELTPHAEKRLLVETATQIAARAPCWRLRYALPHNPWALLDPNGVDLNGAVLAS